MAEWKKIIDEQAKDLYKNKCKWVNIGLNNFGASIKMNMIAENENKKEYRFSMLWDKNTDEMFVLLDE